jgi:hypothetical protein
MCITAALLSAGGAGSGAGITVLVATKWRLLRHWFACVFKTA